MTITLTPEQQKWIEAAVAAGHFPSMEEAIRVAVADLMAIDLDNVGWARPYVDKARESVTRGEITSGEEFLKRLDARLTVLRSS